MTVETRRRIVIISQFYRPEPCAAAHRVAALARALSRQGNDVTVLTTMPSFPSGRIDRRYRGRLFGEEYDGAIKVHRVWAFAAPTLLAYQRVLNWVSAAFGMLLYFMIYRNQIDIVVVSSPPITLAVPALFAAWSRSCKLVADIRDLFPDIGVQMGRWRRNSVAVRLLGALANRLYARSSLIVAVTPAGREELIARNVDPKKITLAMNGADPIRVASQRIFPARNGTFVVAYVGNMGNATGLDALLDAARLLRAKRRFEFILVGGGAQERRLRKRALSESIDNVTFFGVLPRERATRVLADSDLCVVPLAGGIRDSLPTKIFDALSVGCPVIVAAEGEARRFIERSRGGVCVPPDDGAMLAATIERLAEDPAALREYGRRGREFLQAQYDRDAIMNELAARITPAQREVQPKAS
ncbi:MAG: glycosyltransferase family 4 protein [Candidatus Eremiobacteraeota bacterium]|nr:glycosyltransferase family 4 protein [Candidatus Eremiobacteraeota bacterium]